MADPDRDDIATPQREVQRLLGRCLIRIQQYERLLKAIVALQEISGTTQTLPHAIEARRAETSDKTLGTLIGRLLGGYIITEGVEPLAGAADSSEGPALLHNPTKQRSTTGRTTWSGRLGQVG